MAHELSIIDGVAEMAYLVTEGACWHHLGQPVSENATREEWLTASNINSWDVLKCKSTFIDPQGVTRRVPNQLQLVRSDNYKHLATVSEQYNVHQPKEVAEWMFNCVDQLGFEMSTMGVLFDGKKFWCQANIKQSVNIAGVDRVDGKLLIEVANTGKDASKFIYGTTRVVCNNTLRAANREGQSILRVNHLQKFKANEINEQLGLFDLNDWADTAEKMSRIKISDDNVQDYFLKVFDLMEEDETLTAEEIEANNVKALENKAIKTCFELFKGEGLGSELISAKGTLWGAVNAITEYVDHKRNTRTWDARFDSSQFGSWAKVKDRAFDEAILYV